LTFCEAYQAMVEGKRVRRPGWQNLTCLFIRDGKIYSEIRDVPIYFERIAQALVTATDWEILGTTEK
jgi:hypothetical protein